MVPLSWLRRGGEVGLCSSHLWAEGEATGFGKAFYAPHREPHRLGPSPSSGHAWLETRLKCPFMAKGKNAQAEPEAENPRQRRRRTGRCHHPAAPPALPGDTCSSYLTLSCPIPSCRRSGILKLSPKVWVRGADCGMCEYPGPRPETAIAKPNMPYQPSPRQ